MNVEQMEVDEEVDEQREIRRERGMRRGRGEVVEWGILCQETFGNSWMELRRQNLSQNASELCC